MKLGIGWLAPHRRRRASLALGIVLLACQRPVSGPAHPESKPPGPAPSTERPKWLKDARDAQRAAVPTVARSTAASAGFEENIGQFAGDARFIARAGNSTVLLRQGAITTLVAPKPSAEEPEPAALGTTTAKARKPAPAPAPSKPLVPTRIDLRLLDARGDASPKAEGLLPHLIGYFQGQDPKGWLTSVLSYERVVYAEVYSGIDLAVYREGENVKYDFIVAPGASPARIRMQLDGAERATVEASGDLLIVAGDVALRHQKPFIYQERGGKRTPIEGGFIAEAGVVTFRVGDYDPKLPLVIDPTIVQVYSGALAGGFWGHAKGRDVATDADGDAFMTGWVNVFSSSTAFSRDAFVSWFDGATGGLVFTALFSGSKSCSQGNVCDDDDQANAIAIGDGGEIYVAGSTTSISFPVTPDAFDPDCGDDKLCGRGVSLANPPRGDAFALVLVRAPVFVNNTFYWGLGLQWSTFLGGGLTDFGSGIDVDAAGTLYVTGTTQSGTFPLRNAVQTARQGSSDAFVVGLAPSAAQKLVFGTYLGGGGDDFGAAVAVDRARGRVYVAGTTRPVIGAAFPASDPVRAVVRSGDDEAFVAFFDPAGALQAASYVRGASSDAGSGLAVGADGFVYLSGSTTSADLNGLGGPRAGSVDAFVAKLHFTRKRLGPWFSRLDYVTYLGGSHEDQGNALAIDAQNRVYVAGLTRSANFPTAGTPQAPLRATKAVGACGSQNEPCPDSFLARLTDAGQLDFAALFGDVSFDSANGVALRHPGDAVVASESFDPNASIPHYNALLTRVVTGSDLAVTKACTPATVHAGAVATCTLTVTNNGPDPVVSAVVTDTLTPPGWYDALTLGSSGCSMSRNAAGLVERVSCPIQNLPANTSRTFTFPVIAASQGSLADRASLSYADDWNPSNDVSDATIAVVADADLNAWKAHTPDPTPLGSVTSYELWVGNQGPDLATGVQLTDSVPPGLEILSVVTPVGSCSPTEGMGPFTITCDVGALVPPAGLAGTRAVGVQIRARATAAGTFANTATVSGAVNDPVPANDVASDTLTVKVGMPRLRVSINPVRRTPTPAGLEMVLELEIRNSGDGNAQAVRTTGVGGSNIVGTGAVTRVGPYPATWPLLEAGRARSHLVTLMVAPGVTRFEAVFEGDYQDMSGSGNFINFGGTANIAP